MLNKSNTVFHYLHDTIHHCHGYENYLKNARMGRWTIFNWQFTIFGGFYLVAYKMYRELFLYYVLMGMATSVALVDPWMGISSMIGMRCIFSFLIYKLYEMKNNRLMKKINYNPITFIKKTSFHHFVILSLLTFLNIIAAIYSWLLGLVVFNSVLFMLGFTTTSIYQTVFAHF